MTVRDLIEELEEMPQDLPVVTDYRNITKVIYNDNFYFLDKQSDKGYYVEPAVVLE